MYKKFILTVFILTGISYAFYGYFVLNYKMLYMDPEYPMWQEVKNRTNDKDNTSQDLIIIGDSRAKAGFLPNELKNINSINLSVGGGTPIEGYFTLGTYLKNNPFPKAIIISYSSEHLSGSNCYWSRTVAFDFLSNSNYQEIENLAQNFNEELMIHGDKTYLDYKYPSIYGENFKNGLFNLRYLKNKAYLKKCEISKGHHYFGQNNGDAGLNFETEQQSFVYSKLQDHYFKKLLKLVNRSNIKTYFYIMPFNESSFLKIKKRYKEDFTSYLSQLSKEYDMDICNDISFMSNDNFGDPSHLFKGAKKNTQLMYQCVK